MSNAVTLPVRIAAGRTIKIKSSGDRDGGWSTVECVDAEHARQIMSAYPAAEMPRAPPRNDYTHPGLSLRCV